MDPETTLIVAAIAGLIPAWAAHEKGRSFGLWWLYGAGFWLIAIIHVASLKNGVLSLRITRVDPGSRAEEAGLRVDDCIRRVDGTLVRSMERFRTAMKSGNAHALEVLRGLRAVEVHTGQGPLGVGLRGWYAPEHGIPVLRITRVRPRSKADEAGLKVGDLVLSHNGNPVFPVPNELARTLASNRVNALAVRRGSDDLRIDVGKGPIGIRSELGELVALPSATATAKAHEVIS